MGRAKFFVVDCRTTYGSLFTEHSKRFADGSNNLLDGRNHSGDHIFLRYFISDDGLSVSTLACVFFSLLVVEYRLEGFSCVLFLCDRHGSSFGDDEGEMREKRVEVCLCGLVDLCSV